MREPSVLLSDWIFFWCRFVKTTANATVDHLSKYLALRIALEDRRTNREVEDGGREEGGGGGEERAAEGGGEGGGAAGGGGSSKGSSLGSISEKQYTIYIMTRGGQLSVSNYETDQSTTTTNHDVHNSNKLWTVEQYSSFYIYKYFVAMFYLFTNEKQIFNTFSIRLCD